MKAKVDKKRSLEEIKELVRKIDIDKDGYVSEQDLEGYLGRLNFQDFFNGPKAKNQSTKGALTGIFSDSHYNESQKLFPSIKLGGEKMVEMVRKIKEDLKSKGLSYAEAFQKLDLNNAGLISFSIFSQ
mmetsp:Transcript_32138/g.31454  ORF Transcript_32138/g.31454 Transcript_32138/m.31454 type:complete len:128 (+) Transcript_32138:1654-2037(+)